MPFTQIKVIEGVFSEEEKKRMIADVTDALVAIEGESMREKTWVVIEELKSGDWGIGGMALETEVVKELRDETPIPSALD